MLQPFSLAQLGKTSVATGASQQETPSAPPLSSSITFPKLVFRRVTLPQMRNATDLVTEFLAESEDRRHEVTPRARLHVLSCTLRYPS